MVAYLLAPRVNWVPLQHPGYAAYSQPYTQLSVIPPCGLVLSGIAGVTSAPWAALVFTVLYGAAILSIVRVM